MPRVLGGSSGVGVFLWARYPCTVPCKMAEARDDSDHPTRNCIFRFTNPYRLLKSFDFKYWNFENCHKSGHAPPLQGYLAHKEMYTPRGSP